MNASLVLNSRWVPIRAILALRSVVLICRNAARALCPETYQIYDMEAWFERSMETSLTLPPEKLIKTPSILIEKPEIIILNYYGGFPRFNITLNRKNLLRRDGWTCQYCGRPSQPRDLTIDHVLPRSRNGNHSWENCVIACNACNTAKANLTPAEWGCKLKTLPKRPPGFSFIDELPTRYPKSWDPFLKKKIPISS